MIAPARSVTTGWIVASAAGLGLLALSVVPPILGGSAGHIVHEAFGFVCHQIPERSLHLGGGPVALCHRCLGILMGLVAGLAGALALSPRRLRRITRSAQGRWLVLAGIPTTVDWALGALGIWANTPLSRMLTGALFGVVVGVVLAANLLAPPRFSSSPTPSLDAK
ncbi:MAG: DUF2085 domain-containing protein [Bacteroidota bacterium]